MKTRKLALATATLSALAPATAFGAQTIIDLSNTIQRTIFTPVSQLIIGFALLMFVWGVYRYIAQAGDETKAQEGIKMMSYGIVVLFVMVCIWGIVKLGLSFFGFPA